MIDSYRISKEIFFCNTCIISDTYLTYKKIYISGNHSTSCSYTEAKPSDNDYRQLFEQNKGEPSILLYKLIICQRCLLFVSLLLILVASIVMNMICNHIYRNNPQCSVINTMYNMTEYANVSSNGIVCQP